MSEVRSAYDLATNESQRLVVEQNITYGCSVMRVDFGISEFGKFDDRFLYQIGKLYRENRMLYNLAKGQSSFSGHIGVNNGKTSDNIRNPTFMPSCPVVEDLEKSIGDRTRKVNIDLNPMTIKPDARTLTQSYRRANAGVISRKIKEESKKTPPFQKEKRKPRERDIT